MSGSILWDYFRDYQKPAEPGGTVVNPTAPVYTTGQEVFTSQWYYERDPYGKGYQSYESWLTWRNKKTLADYIDTSGYIIDDPSWLPGYTGDKGIFIPAGIPNNVAAPAVTAPIANVVTTKTATEVAMDRPLTSDPIIYLEGLGLLLWLFWRLTK